MPPSQRSAASRPRRASPGSRPAITRTLPKLGCRTSSTASGARPSPGPAPGVAAPGARGPPRPASRSARKSDQRELGQLHRLEREADDGDPAVDARRRRTAVTRVRPPGLGRDQHGPSSASGCRRTTVVQLHAARPSAPQAQADHEQMLGDDVVLAQGRVQAPGGCSCRLRRPRSCPEQEQHHHRAQQAGSARSRLPANPRSRRFTADPSRSGGPRGSAPAASGRGGEGLAPLAGSWRTCRSWRRRDSAAPPRPARPGRRPGARPPPWSAAALVGTAPARAAPMAGPSSPMSTTCAHRRP